MLPEFGAIAEELYPVQLIIQTLGGRLPSILEETSDGELVKRIQGNMKYEDMSQIRMDDLKLIESFFRERCQRFIKTRS